MNYRKFFQAPTFQQLLVRRQQEAHADDGMGDQVAAFLFEDSPSGGQKASEASVVTWVSPELAVNLAMVTGRPLLVYGPTGCGKSTLAKAVAIERNAPFFHKVIEAGTRARDLMWEYDAIHRLGDAHAMQKDKVNQHERYIKPGVLWKAFHLEDANTFPLRDLQDHPKDKSGKTTPEPDEGRINTSHVIDSAMGAVVLLDEIDKADPSLPNNLLDPLSRLSFTVSESGFTREVRAKAALDPDIDLEKRIHRWPLIVITTNDERELPDAFVRRCIRLDLTQPTHEVTLTRIAQLHFPHMDVNICEVIAAKVAKFMDHQGEHGRTPSTAEFLDVFRSINRLRLDQSAVDQFMSGLHWDAIIQATLWKHRPSQGKRP